MTMFKVNIHQAKARLSEFLEAVERGERVVICKRNRPVAELRAIAPARAAVRPLGDTLSGFEVPPEFFEALPDDLLDGFSGELLPAAARVGRRRDVAERPAAPYGNRTSRKRRSGR
jgi:prevent-host-death family protein